MRRLDTRPFKKLRNPGRHLRALARWPERIAESVPDASVFTGELFCNFRIPVYSKLVEPPHATPATQRACIAAIFAAAEALGAIGAAASGLPGGVSYNHAVDVFVRGDAVFR